MRRLLLVLAAAAAIGSIALLSGCGTPAETVIGLNQAPQVRLTAAPPTYATGDRYFYSVTLNWTAFDPDGRVDHFLIAVIDLPGVRTQLPDSILARYSSTPRWVRTDRSDTTIRFQSTYSRRDTLFADDSHIFLIKAVDDRGAESEIQRRAFFSNTLAPTVKIDSPSPSRQSRSFVTPAVLIDWHGDDLDGVLTKQPIQYKYILLSDQSQVTLATALADPDSVRRYYAPRNWAGWDSTSSDTSLVQYTNLIPSKDYMFVVIAFDEAGAYSPVFDRGINMLLMRVTFAGNNNPTISFFNEFFSYTYPAGSYEPLNPERVISLELPANERVTFNWFAEAVPGSAMRSYRWAVDILDLNDNTQRTDQETDLAHWSPKNINTVSATIGPYPGDNQVRRFYLEAEDINGLKSLGIIAFQTIAFEPTRPLLVVKDMRLLVDKKATSSATCVLPPANLRWPNAAELDTFLFARGGFPWRCYGPTGTLSSPGIMKGFDFDTVGTRIARVDQTVRLSKLSNYSHVVWIADINGSSSNTEGTSQSPMSALKYMTAPNRANTLATYVRQGGKVWVCGGGALEATMYWYDRVNNNTTQPAPGKTYAFDNNELVPGRFLFDIFKWQTEVKITNGTIDITRELGRNASDPYYASLPARLDFHSEADGDTFPPGRLPRIDQNFYYDIINMEYLSRPNPYYEDINPDPVAENLVSGLDTLYQAAGVSLVQTQIPNPTNFNNVCMTVWPARSLGSSNPNQCIFSGFDIWSFRKSQCRELVHFVLNQLWGLPDNVPPHSRVVLPRAELSPPATSSPTPGSIQSPRPIRSGDSARPVRTSRTGSR